MSADPAVSRPADGIVDVAVIGAGAAGVGAARRLAASSLSVLVLEASNRAGGRAHTLAGRSGAGIDLGCGWLHSADQNPWVALAESEGFELDRSRPSWERRLTGVNMSDVQAREFGRAFEVFEAKLEAAAAEPDRPAAELFDEITAPWRPMLDAFSSYYNGALFRDISVHDYAAYQPTDENWRVVQGYGALVAQTAAGLPIVFKAPVTRIDRTGSPLRLATATGEVQARMVIVAVPTTILSEDRLAFDPPLPDHAAAADALPLGHVDKCFLALAERAALPVEMMVTGRTTTADTGSYTLQPFGRPMIEGFFGGDLAEALEAEPPGAFSAFAIDELAALFGSSLRRALRPIAESRWGADPYIRGAYSHARPGQAGARAALRRPVEDRIFFAGEACSAHAFSTCHGAYQTGVEAAETVLAGHAPGGGG
ncbi:NAD(P)/FAD-dependent oxidoreductase [Caulobacter sp. S45]|uniref:flavin monoamine oxidase family protein n=1 Tax=Caulobacter sp. S45 TaxID=1641861 RepID=UPI001575FC3F|nr:NAD(P)/FAD-dependent oxidoreductase [Caulobacter sp. S45]